MVNDRAESGAENSLGSEQHRQVAALVRWAEQFFSWMQRFVLTPIPDTGTREPNVFRHAPDPSRIDKITQGSGWGVFPASLASTRHKPVRYWFDVIPILAKGLLLESLHVAVARLDSQSHLADPF